MKKITQEEFDLILPNKKGVYRYPADTDYSDIKMFNDLSIFEDNCMFGDNHIFGKHCAFGDSCQFGDCCNLDKYPRFGTSCWFGDHCSFSQSGVFGEACDFGHSCKFGDSCYFGDHCVFENNCEFGDRCYFVKSSNLLNNQTSNPIRPKISTNFAEIYKKVKAEHPDETCTCFDKIAIIAMEKAVEKAMEEYTIVVVKKLEALSKDIRGW